jgi:hypothetical protein
MDHQDQRKCRFPSVLTGELGHLIIWCWWIFRSSGRSGTSGSSGSAGSSGASGSSGSSGSAGSSGLTGANGSGQVEVQDHQG